MRARHVQTVVSNRQTVLMKYVTPTMFETNASENQNDFIFELLLKHSLASDLHTQDVRNDRLKQPFERIWPV